MLSSSYRSSKEGPSCRHASRTLDSELLKNAACAAPGFLVDRRLNETSTKPAVVEMKVV